MSCASSVLCSPGRTVSQQPVHQWIHDLTQFQTSDVPARRQTLLAQEQVGVSPSPHWAESGLERRQLKPVSFLYCRNPSKPHLRPTIPAADRGTGLLDNPGLFPSFPSERLNGVRSSPPTRLPASQSRTRLPSSSAFPRRDAVGMGRVTEPTTTDYALGIGRGRYGAAVCVLLSSERRSGRVEGMCDVERVVFTAP